MEHFDTSWQWRQVFATMCDILLSMQMPVAAEAAEAGAALADGLPAVAATAGALAAAIQQEHGLDADAAGTVRCS